MQFNSFAFFGFFAAVFALYWALPARRRMPVLALASAAFYAAFGPVYLALLAGLSAAVWAMGLWLGRRATRRRLALALCICLVPLALFKYCNAMLDVLTGLSGALRAAFAPLYLPWAAPAGISYYTFQMVSYLVDIYRGRLQPARRFLPLALSFGLFLQVTAGPLTRPRDLLPALQKERAFNCRAALSGAQLALWGLCKKVVMADTLNYYTAAVFADPQKLHGFSLVIVVLFYAVQIYADFSGYTDMARGLGAMLGLELAENFRAPYFAPSIKEFWNRWHISLSGWLKEYVYIPLGGSRVGKARHCFNLFATFVVSGLWHGANAPMLAWGALHGAYMVAGTLTAGVRSRLWAVLPLRREGPAGRVFSAGVTFCLVCLGWIFFASPNWANAVYILTHLFYDFVPGVNYLKESVVLLGLTVPACVRFAVQFAALFAVELAAARTGYAVWLAARRPWFQAALSYVWAAALVLWGNIGGGSFMYFRF